MDERTITLLVNLELQWRERAIAEDSEAANCYTNCADQLLKILMTMGGDPRATKAEADRHDEAQA